MSPFATALFEGALAGSSPLNYEAKIGPTFGGLTMTSALIIDPIEREGLKLSLSPSLEEAFWNKKREQLLT